MKIPRSSGRRLGVAGIVGALFLFAMLFTIGTSYFIFVNNADLQATQALVNRSNALASRVQENMVVSALLTSTSHVAFYLNNTGGQLTTLNALLLLDSSGNILKCLGVGLPTGQSCSNTTPALPLVANIGKGIPATGTIDTGYSWTSGTVTLKLITALGNIFSATYPPTAVPLALLAVTTQGAGLLEINFDTFRAYNATGTAPGCNPTNSGCQLTPWPAGTNGYTLSSITKTGQYYVFTVDMTNVDPQKRTITLDGNSALTEFQVPSGGGGTARAWTWGIGRVNTNGITVGWSSITLTPSQTTAVSFVVIPSTSTGGGSWPPSGAFMAVFIYLHGTVGSAPYGQNIPFVTTLYR